MAPFDKAAFPICLAAVALAKAGLSAAAVAKAAWRRASRAHPGLSRADRFDDAVAGGTDSRTLLGSALLLKREIQSFRQTTEGESRATQRDILFSEPGEFFAAPSEFFAAM